MENEEIQMNSPNRRDDQKAFILKERIADMYRYGKKIVDRFPGRDKELASEIRQSMLTMFRLVVKIEKKYYKKSTLQELDEELEVLRHLVRIAADKDYYDQEVPKKDKNATRYMTSKESSSLYLFLRLFPCIRNTCGIVNI